MCVVPFKQLTFKIHDIILVEYCICSDGKRERKKRARTKRRTRTKTKHKRPLLGAGIIRVDVLLLLLSLLSLLFCCSSSSSSSCRHRRCCYCFPLSSTWSLCSGKVSVCDAGLFKFDIFFLCIEKKLMYQPDLTLCVGIITRKIGIFHFSWGQNLMH